MVRFAAMGDHGRLLVAVGMNDVDVETVKRDGSVFFALADMISPLVPAGKIDVMVFHGATDEAIHAKMRELGNVTPSTEFRSPRDKANLH